MIPDRFREDRDEPVNRRQAILDDPMGPSEGQDLHGPEQTMAKPWAAHPDVEAAYQEAERRGMLEVRRGA